MIAPGRSRMEASRGFRAAPGIADTSRPRHRTAPGCCLAVLALLLAGCATEAPAPIAVPEPAPPPPVGWEPIPSLNTSCDIVSGYVQRRGLVRTGAVRRAWILLNLRDPIPIPETGGEARSVRFMGEYRCAARQWRPLEGAWFARRNAQEPVHAERPRRRDFQAAEPGTLGGSFLDAACGL